jgi:hypothetical protein
LAARTTGHHGYSQNKSEKYADDLHGILQCARCAVDNAYTVPPARSRCQRKRKPAASATGFQRANESAITGRRRHLPWLVNFGFGFAGFFLRLVGGGFGTVLDRPGPQEKRDDATPSRFLAYIK